MTCVHRWGCDDCPGTYICCGCGMFGTFDRHAGVIVEVGPLCGSCSDDMGDTLDAWADADDIAPADRIPCGRCGC